MPPFRCATGDTSLTDYNANPGLEQFDRSAVSADGGKGRIPGDKRSLQDFSQRHIRRVVHSKIVSQFPDARQEQIVGIPNERKVRQVLKRLRAAIWCQYAARRVSSQYLRDFEINQVRDVQRVAGTEESIGHTIGTGGI